jgi:hypothetical protein
MLVVMAFAPLPLTAKVAETGPSPPSAGVEPGIVGKTAGNESQMRPHAVLVCVSDDRVDGATAVRLARVATAAVALERAATGENGGDVAGVGPHAAPITATVAKAAAASDELTGRRIGDDPRTTGVRIATILPPGKSARRSRT